MAMALSSVKVSELPLHKSMISAPIRSRPSLSFLRRRFRLLFSTTACSRRSSLSGGAAGDQSSSTRSLPWDEDSAVAAAAASGAGISSCSRGNPAVTISSTPSASWLRQWSPPDSQPLPDRRNAETGGGGSIDRIVQRLRNLGLGLDEDGDVLQEEPGQRPQLDGSERLSDLLEQSWNRPDTPYVDQPVLPWEREEYERFADADLENQKKKRVRAPWLAELTIEDTELRRLRRLGMVLRERISVPKAGLTQPVMEKIHDTWRKSELARLKFHEVLARDMKTAHEIVERRTGGLVIWRSGSIMVVYRGSNYQRPSKFQPSETEVNVNKVLDEVNEHVVPDVSSTPKTYSEQKDHSFSSTSNHLQPYQTLQKSAESMTEEETEFNLLLDDFGPRFVDWWGTGILPVDADLLPQTIPGYKPPFRLLPVGMRSHLTNAEMTNLRKLAKALPCHFALGRNRHHQGLAAAILRLWETNLIAKIAVKRGVQNTNNKLMAEELKNLTGGVLLLRNKYYIVIYRGKDFLPASVATALAERQQLTKDIQDAEEKSRNSLVAQTCFDNNLEEHALAGTLAEFQEAQARWGRVITADERDVMKQEASRSAAAKMFKKIEHKLYIAQAKKLRAEKLLAKVEASMIPVNPSDDQETITDEERSVFRRIALRMKAYLPLGIRGVFDGVIENMHLHWKHRELVKLISKQKTLSFVEDTARLLEYESRGILVAVERVPKGFALIYYRGKNYQRPVCLRPRNLLTKAKALKRSIAMQRHEALSQHIIELEKSIEQIKLDMGIAEVDRSSSPDPSYVQSGQNSEFSESEGYEDDYGSDISDFDDMVDGEDEDDYDSEIS
ncbi:Chloroplastic group IIA intron splicing facilitator CRS1, chloroplastic [Apostasia shenzhenica]|uniref:CRM-domain containing factor CFM3, chloroplastic/mitochondrial n=1 Tax=Apostasia shenzhenica TaxID=1088818 RepID=A0A2I0B0W6_9ASPA|nr:Chloroplastic group IIA intron splicing facilitator CRS1, chloroplastic [Apostasia shenzhenica]